MVAANPASARAPLTCSMLLKPAVALLMGNPFAGSANTLDAPSKPMPATSKVAIAMIRISFPPVSFT
jgi:hypothetical protein